MIAGLFLVHVGPGQDEEAVGHVGQGDPHLLAVQDVVVAFPPGGSLHADHVGTSVGFGHAEGADVLALGQRHQIFLFLLLGAPLEYAQAAQAHVNAHDHPCRGVHSFQFLAGQAQGDVVHAGSSVVDRHADAQQSLGGHLGQQRAVEGLFPVVFLDFGGNFPFGELPHRLADHFVLFSECEIHLFPP